jgi:RimJ/RimL family protein N-acetyltransferase
MKPSKIIIETERLILRTWKESDIAPIVALNKDPRVMEFFPSVLTQKQTEEFIKRLEKHFEKHGFTLYPVELKKTHQCIGFVGLATIPFKTAFTPAIEIGWRLAYDYWGKGYATEAAKAVLNYAFNDLKMNKIVSFTTSKNVGSRRVMEKIGMIHNPKYDFNHPKLGKDSPLLKHVFYEIIKT